MSKGYYLTGPDGSGKTTFLNVVIDKLQSLGKIVQHVWIRSPKILSKPLMAYCRLAGLTKYKTINGIRYGVHEFYRSKFVSWIFPILQLIDFKIKKWLVFRKISKKHGFTILLDRFAIDTLADLMVDTERYDLHLKRIGKNFLKLIPDNTRIIVLNVNEKEIRKRKQDTLNDPHLSQKIKVFNILSKDLNLKVIDNNRPFEIVHKDILKEFGLIARN